MVVKKWVDHHCPNVKLGYKLGTVPIRRNSNSVIVTVYSKHIALMLVDTETMQFQC